MGPDSSFVTDWGCRHVPGRSDVASPLHVAVILAVPTTPVRCPLR